jgi:type IV pilus assembly protein PilM
MPLRAPKPNFNFALGSRRGGSLVGLDIQPGYVTAVQAHVNGGIVVQHAAGAALAPDAVREGEVLDERTLSEALRELFSDGRLSRRVRIGLANQRTVLRTLELPPVTDRKELAAAVRFQAEDQVPMPLAGAVLDYHSLGTFETADGPRQRVIVVAAQREMVERLLRAVRHAGLRPEGVDLSAFALIRSLYRAAGAQEEGEQAERVLYLNVGGLTNMAIAEGTVCRFTRVVGGGLEAMAVEIAERRGIPLVDARALLAAIDLNAVAVVPAQAPAALPVAPVVEQGETVELGAGPDETEPLVDFHEGFGHPPEPDAIETWALAQDPSATETPSGSGQYPAGATPSESGLSSAGAGPGEPLTAGQHSVEAAALQAVQASGGRAPDADVRMVLENGIREIVGELRNSLDFHRAQGGGGEVSRVVLSGGALEIPGFAEALEADLGMTVHCQSVGVSGPDVTGGVSPNHLAIATGLATDEVPR